MSNILITGFTPFDGRLVNASWIAAASLEGSGINTMQIPVIWGAASALLESACHEICPEIIISLGEGREGWFDIETRASNTRKERPDNNNRLPTGTPISQDGPASRKIGIDMGFLQRVLTGAGYPVRLSSDAGQFLCEEALYTLIKLQASHTQLRLVVFCHVPPYGTQVRIENQRIECNTAILTTFASRLLSAVLAL
jgi:pyroglutamyl-peptidase